MLGIESPGVYLAYLLTIVSMLFCVVYGIINWNVGGDNEDKEIDAEIKWEKKKQEIDKNL